MRLARDSSAATRVHTSDSTCQADGSLAIFFDQWLSGYYLLHPPLSHGLIRLFRARFCSFNVQILLTVQCSHNKSARPQGRWRRGSTALLSFSTLSRSLRSNHRPWRLRLAPAVCGWIQAGAGRIYHLDHLSMPGHVVAAASVQRWRWRPAAA